LKTGNNNVVQKVENQIFFEKVPLNPIEAESVIRLLMLSGQLEIPSDERIPNWKTTIDDCSSIQFQFKINGQYKSQHYFCPWCQNDSLVYKNIGIGA
jgi:hypothetical protein